MRVLGISGSLRQGSYNSLLLAAAATEAPAGVEFVGWGGLAGIPAYSEDHEGFPPPAVLALREEIARADAVLIATPEYNASIPGALKNALDWASRPYATNVLRDKRVAVIGTSQGLFGAVWAQAELRRVLKAIGARVDDRELPVPQARTAFTDDGRLRDPALALSLRSIVRDLLETVAQRAA